MGTTAKRWTDEEVQWLKENYADHTTQYCVLHLHAGAKRILKKAAELGLTKKEKPKKPKKPKRKTEGIHIDEGAQYYCMDCACYQKGGYCTRKKADVGALWLKKCNKLREKREDQPKVVSKVAVLARGIERRRWTEADEAILREMYPTHSSRALEIKLQRSRASILQRAFKLGIQGKK